MNALELTRQKFVKESIDVNGVSVEIVRTRGRGQAVLMLPGAQGTAESFCHQLLAFGEDRDIIGVNYPGLDTVVAVADLLLALLARLGVQRFDLVGTSLGGYVAQWIAASQPRGLGRVVIGNSFMDPRPIQAPEKLAALQAKSPEELKREVVERLKGSPASDFRSIMLDLVGLQQPATQLIGRMLLVQRAAPLEADVPPDLPLLLVECDNDPLIPVAVREAIRDHYPNAERSQISGGSHYPFLLNPNDYNQAIGAFLGLR